MVANEWDDHWSKRYVSLNVVFNSYRKYIMSNALSYFFERYFPKKGVFVECGSGSSLTTHSVKKHGRTFIALDYSIVAVKEARKLGKIDAVIHGDTKALPLRSGSVDGIWNLGVMEHFSLEEIDQILKEYRRVLKKGGRIILFWPPVFSFTGVAYRSIEGVIRLITRKDFHFYPAEPSRLKSMAHAKKVLEKNRFRECEVFFPWRNCFGDLVLIGRK